MGAARARMPASPTRILYVQHFSALGGSSYSLSALVSRLDRSQHEPSVVFVGCSEGPAMDLFRDQGIAVHHLPDVGYYQHGQGTWLSPFTSAPWKPVTRWASIGAEAKRFAAFLNQQKPDLVHLNSMLHVPAALGAEQAGIPVVWHVREELHPGIFGARAAWIRGLFRRIPKAVIAISKRNAERVGRPDADVVYNFVDQARFGELSTQLEARERLGWDVNVPTVMSLGGFIPHKGPEVFLETAKALRRRCPDAHVYLAGYPLPEESPSIWKRTLRRRASTLMVDSLVRCHELMRQPEVRDSFSFLGARDDVESLLAASDVVWWTGTASHFPRPVMEAAFVGRPVVVTDLASTREIVDDEVGRLFPVGDPDRGAALTAALLLNPDLRAQLGNAAKRRASEHYDPDTNTKTVVDIYRRIREAA